MIDSNKLARALNLTKEAYAPPSPPPGADPAMMGGAPPMDPAMMDPSMAMGGMPPPPMPPGGGAPMDPAMMGMDPAMMGAPPMDPSMGGMPPMDPSMGGMPPMDPSMGGMPPMDPSMGGMPPPPMPPEGEAAPMTVGEMAPEDFAALIAEAVGGGGGEEASEPDGEKDALETRLDEMEDLVAQMAEALGIMPPEGEMPLEIGGPPPEGEMPPPMDPAMMDPALAGPLPPNTGMDMGLPEPPPAGMPGMDEGFSDAALKTASQEDQHLADLMRTLERYM